MKLKEHYHVFAAVIDFNPWQGVEFFESGNSQIQRSNTNSTSSGRTDSSRVVASQIEIDKVVQC